MTIIPPSAMAQTVLASAPDADAAAVPSVLAAAGLLLPHLEGGQRIEAAILRGAMDAAFGASDAAGAWDWKMAYDACEAATVLFLSRYGRALARKAADHAALLSQLGKIAGLLPTQTRRSEASQTFQQFSTPIPLGFVAVTAAAITPADQVLEPSAGTGLMAILAEIAGGTLLLNELAEMRASLLSSLFPALSVTRFDAAQIHDHLDPGLVPTVVLMNPPFSALTHVEGRVADAAFRHIGSAFARLALGGRLVTITGASLAPDNPAWTAAWRRLQERGRVVFSAAIDGAVYAPHGTTTPTRLTVIDKRPADDPAAFPGSLGMAPDVATLLAWLTEHLPARVPVEPGLSQPIASAVPRAGTRQPRRPLSPVQARPLRLRSSLSRKARRSFTRRSTGSLPKPIACRTPFTRTMRFRPSASPGQRPIPRPLCNRRRWQASRRPSPATGRRFRRTSSAGCRKRNWKL